MSCPKTQYLLTEYFADNLSAIARDELEKHIETCDSCSAELIGIKNTQSKIEQWQDERIPHWDRGANLFRHEQASQHQSKNWIWQWLPTATSFAMLCVLAFNFNLSSGENGFTISFGSEAGSVDYSQIDQRVSQLAEIQQLEQEQTLQAFLSRMDERQDSNNLRLMQAVMDQTQQMTAENFDQMYTYFEQQRQLDMENVEVSYQQLVDSDFDTMRSMQQLANFVRYTGETR
jgi:hypothetical protein